MAAHVEHEAAVSEARLVGDAHQGQALGVALSQLGERLEGVELALLGR